MLFRGTEPLTEDECLDYEIHQELCRLRDLGLVMESIDTSTGEIVWSKTLKGVLLLRPLDSEQLIRITFEMLDSSC